MVRPRISSSLAFSIFDRHKGRCHHCGKRLRKSMRKSWHIDHHPIPFRDVEDQCCFGVRDPLAATNLVLSCVHCNVSHHHEPSYWYYCGHAQFPCKKKQWTLYGIILLSSLLSSSATLAFLIVKKDVMC